MALKSFSGAFMHHLMPDDVGQWTIAGGQILTNHAIRLRRTDHATAAGGLILIPASGVRYPFLSVKPRVG